MESGEVWYRKMWNSTGKQWHSTGKATRGINVCMLWRIGYILSYERSVPGCDNLLSWSIILISLPLCLVVCCHECDLKVHTS